MNDYHSLFYYRVLVPLRGLKDKEGGLIQGDPQAEGQPEFRIAYVQRADSYRHNYLRNKDLANRDILLLATSPITGQRIVLLRKERRGDKVTIFNSAVKYLFPDDADNALIELNNILSKFYTTTTDVGCDLDRADLSESGSSNHVRVYDPR